MNTQVISKASSYNELYGLPIEAQPWGDASSRHAKFDDYLMCRKKFEAKLQSQRSFLKSLMISSSPISSEDSAGLTYMLDQIVDNRIELSKRSSEFYKSYGTDVNELATKFSEKALPVGYGIRSKTDILMDCIKIYDDPYSSVRINGISVDSQKHNHSLDVKAAYGAAVRKEWERCYPGEDFYEAYDKMLEEYVQKQNEEIKEYIDTVDCISNLDRQADYYSSTGMIRDWKQTRMKIGAMNRTKEVLRENWHKKYGRDTIMKAANDKYDEIYPGRKQIEVNANNDYQVDDELSL